MLRLIALIGLTSLASAGLGAQVANRAAYQRAIDRYYPGFRIIPIADFERPRDAKDGVRGAVVAGRFDFDNTTDFAAYIIPANAGRGQGSPAANAYAGKLVMCLGAAGGTYKCDAQDRPFTLPLDSQLEIVPPGRYACYGSGPAVTTIASVGEGSDVGGGLYVRNRDGSIRLCITAD